MSVRDSKLSQLRQVMNMNDKSDSKFELDEEKREKQKKRQQLDKKIQMKQRALMKDDL
jgi:hypothetical protein